MNIHIIVEHVCGGENASYILFGEALTNLEELEYANDNITSCINEEIM